MTGSQWPLFDLVVRSPRLENSAGPRRGVPALDRTDRLGHPRSVHHAVHQPVDECPLPQRNLDSYQWWWRQRAAWRPDDWAFDGSVLVDGHVIGVQSIMAFAGLGARVAYSGAFSGLVRHRWRLAHSAIGRMPRLRVRRGEPAEIVNLRLDRDDWDAGLVPARLRVWLDVAPCSAFRRTKAPPRAESGLIPRW